MGRNQRVWKHQLLQTILCDLVKKLTRIYNPALVVLFTVANESTKNLNEKSSSGFKVASDKVIEADHVLLLGELNVICDVLQDLGHQHQPAFDVLRWLLLHNAHLEGRDDCGVYEAEEHDRSDGSDVALLTLRESFTENLFGEMKLGHQTTQNNK